MFLEFQQQQNRILIKLDIFNIEINKINWQNQIFIDYLWIPLIQTRVRVLLPLFDVSGVCMSVVCLLLVF